MIKRLLVRFVREDKGQDLIEYALLAGLIVVVSMGTVTALGTQIDTRLGNVSTGLAS
jgi:Flp pilus assembly pilin Flp